MLLIGEVIALLPRLRQQRRGPAQHRAAAADRAEVGVRLRLREDPDVRLAVPDLACVAAQAMSRRR
jgi:hypothetical protein